VLTDPKAVLFLDCHGKDLGSTDGELSLLILGLPESTYIVDAITLADDIPRLAPYLQNRDLRKVVWDGRLGYSELWHGFGIRLENVLNLQLAHLHGKYDITQRKSIPLSGKMTAVKDKKLLSAAGIEVEQKRTSQSPPNTGRGCHRIINKTWTDRPLSQSHLDFTSIEMAHLRLLSSTLIPLATKYPHVLRESKRYIELWHHHRRDSNNPYYTHFYLPQGIIERTETERSWRLLGTRRCRGCERDLYQESYQLEFRRWQRTPEKQFCYTCAKVKLRRYRRTTFLDILELSKSRASPAPVARVTQKV
jgi:exonuclease 3'-5' domain-containing protein 1